MARSPRRRTSWVIGTEYRDLDVKSGIAARIEPHMKELVFDGAAPTGRHRIVGAIEQELAQRFTGGANPRRLSGRDDAGSDSLPVNTTGSCD